MRLAITWLLLVPAIFGQGNAQNVIAGRDIHSTSNTYVNVVNVKASEGGHSSPVNIVNHQHAGRSNADAHKSANRKLEDESGKVEEVTTGKLDGLISKLSHALTKELTKKSLNTSAKCTPNIEVLDISTEITVDLEPANINDTDSEHLGAHEHKGVRVLDIEFEETEIILKNRTTTAASSTTTDATYWSDTGETSTSPSTLQTNSYHIADIPTKYLSEADSDRLFLPNTATIRSELPEELNSDEYTTESTQLIDVRADDFSGSSGWNKADDSNPSLNDRDGAEEYPSGLEKVLPNDRVLDYVIDEPEDNTYDESNPPSNATDYPDISLSSETTECSMDTTTEPDIYTEDQTEYNDGSTDMPFDRTRNLPSTPQKTYGSKKPGHHPSRDRLTNHGTKKPASNNSSRLPYKPSTKKNPAGDSNPPSKDQILDYVNDEVTDYPFVAGDEFSDYPSDSAYDSFLPSNKNFLRSFSTSSGASSTLEPIESTTVSTFESTSPETIDSSTSEPKWLADQTEYNDEPADNPSDEGSNSRYRPNNPGGQKKPAYLPSKGRVNDRANTPSTKNNRTGESYPPSRDLVLDYVADEETDYSLEFEYDSSTLESSQSTTDSYYETSVPLMNSTTDESVDNPSDGARNIPSRPSKTAGGQRPAYSPSKGRVNHRANTPSTKKNRTGDSYSPSKDQVFDYVIVEETDYDSEFKIDSSILEPIESTTDSSSETTDSSVDSTTEPHIYTDDQTNYSDEPLDNPLNRARNIPSRPIKTADRQRSAYPPSKRRVTDRANTPSHMNHLTGDSYPPSKEPVFDYVIDKTTDHPFEASGDSSDYPSESEYASSTLNVDSFPVSTSAQTTDCSTDSTTEQVTYTEDQTEYIDEPEDVPSDGARNLPSQPNRTSGSKRPAYHPPKDRLIDHVINKPARNNSSRLPYPSSTNKKPANKSIQPSKDYPSESEYDSSTFDPIQSTTDFSSDNTDWPADATTELDTLIKQSLSPEQIAQDIDDFINGPTTEPVTYSEDQTVYSDEPVDVPSDGARNLPSRPNRTSGKRRPADHPSKDRVIDHVINKPARNNSSRLPYPSSTNKKPANKSLQPSKDYPSESEYDSSTFDPIQSTTDFSSDNTDWPTDATTELDTLIKQSLSPEQIAQDIDDFINGPTTEPVTYSEDQTVYSDEPVDVPSDGARNLPSRPNRTSGKRRPADHPSKDRVIDHVINKPARNNSSRLPYPSSTNKKPGNKSNQPSKDYPSESEYDSSTFDPIQSTTDFSSDNTDWPTDATTEPDRLIKHSLSPEQIAQAIDDFINGPTTEPVTYSEDQTEYSDEPEDVNSDGTRHLPSRPNRTSGRRRPADHPSKDRVTDHVINKPARNNSSRLPYPSSTNKKPANKSNQPSKDYPSESEYDSSTFDPIQSTTDFSSDITDWPTDATTEPDTLIKQSLSPEQIAQAIDDFINGPTTELVTYSEDQTEYSDEPEDVPSDGARNLPSWPNRTSGNKRPVHHPSKDRVIDHVINKPARTNSSRLPYPSSTNKKPANKSNQPSKDYPSESEYDSSSFDPIQFTPDSFSTSPETEDCSMDTTTEPVLYYITESPLEANGESLTLSNMGESDYENNRSFETGDFELPTKSFLNYDTTPHHILPHHSLSHFWPSKNSTSKSSSLTTTGFSEESSSTYESATYDSWASHPGSMSTPLDMDDRIIKGSTPQSSTESSSSTALADQNSSESSSESTLATTTPDTTESYSSSTNSYETSDSSSESTLASSTNSYETSDSSSDSTFETTSTESTESFMSTNSTSESTESSLSSTNAYETSESSSESTLATTTPDTTESYSSSTNSYETSDSSSESTLASSTNSYETSDSSSDSTFETTSTESTESFMSTNSTSESTESSLSSTNTYETSESSSESTLATTTPNTTESYSSSTNSYETSESTLASSTNSYETSDSSSDSTFETTSTESTESYMSTNSTSESTESSLSSTNTYETSESSSESTLGTTTPKDLSSEYTTEPTSATSSRYTTETSPSYDVSTVEPYLKPTIAPFPEACPPHTTSIELPFIPLILLYPMVDTTHNPSIQSAHSINPFSGNKQLPIKGGCVICIPFGSDAMSTAPGQVPVGPGPVLPPMSVAPNDLLSAYQLFINQMMRHT